MTAPIRLLRHPLSKSTVIHLHCHIKPSAAKIREGVTCITSEFIHVCVSARPINGESNEAVREVISRVMGVPKSDIEIVKGLKNKEKVVAVGGISFGDLGGKDGSEDRWIEAVRRKLEQAVGS